MSGTLARVFWVFCLCSILIDILRAICKIINVKGAQEVNRNSFPFSQMRIPMGQCSEIHTFPLFYRQDIYMEMQPLYQYNITDILYNYNYAVIYYTFSFILLGSNSCAKKMDKLEGCTTLLFLFWHMCSTSPHCVFYFGAFAFNSFAFCLK